MGKREETIKENKMTQEVIIIKKEALRSIVSSLVSLRLQIVQLEEQVRKIRIEGLK